jgi:hypothetical protein
MLLCWLALPLSRLGAPGGVLPRSLWTMGAREVLSWAPCHEWRARGIRHYSGGSGDGGRWERGASQEITSLQNPRVKLLRSLLSRKGRDKEGFVLLEGTKLLSHM